MNKFPYLVAEVNAALEIYLSGRTGQQYNRTAFILCDDCAELASKLFLLTHVNGWNDKRENGFFKKFKEITGEVRSTLSVRRPNDSTSLKEVLHKIEQRRDRRNEFFHSTHLLDLTLHSRDCVEAFCDLMDYGKMLFPDDWDSAVDATSSMRTNETIIRLDKKGYGDTSIHPRMNAIIGNWPRTGQPPKKKGCEVTHYAEDMHLRLAIRNGGQALLDRLKVLL